MNHSHNNTLRRFIVTLVMVALVATPPAFGNPIIFGLPPSIAPDDFEGVVTAVIGAVEAGEPDDTFVFIDAWDQTEICRVTIPDKPKRVRDRELARQLTGLIRFLRAARENADHPGRIHLPRFFDMVAGLNAAPAHVVLIGSPYNTDERDGGAVFGPGFIPSDRHLTVTSRRSVYGTADLHGRLDGLVVHFAVIGSQGGTTEQRSLKRFWGNWAGRQGAALATYGPGAKTAADNARAGLSEPVEHEPIDPADNVLEIREAFVQPVRQPGEAEVPHTPEAPLVIMPPTHMDFVIVADGTFSQQPFLNELEPALVETAELLGGHFDQCRLGLVIYRDEDSTQVLPMTPVNVAGGRPDEDGLAAIRTFLTDPVIELSIVDGASGESGGQATGKTRMASRLDAIMSKSDLEHAINIAIDLLNSEAQERTTPVLLLLTDQGTWEMGSHMDAIDPEDRVAAERIQEAVERLAMDRSAQVHVVFTGRETGVKHRSETTAFLQSLASAAGEGGRYHEGVAADLPAIAREALAER